jgi:xanthine/CO dehydrogenase XdhC/CoxF family maturation factor
MGHHSPGTCRSCGQPSGQCGCGCRECRKESKELVVRSSVAAGQDTKLNTVLAAAMQQPHNLAGLRGIEEPRPAAAAAAGAEKAIDTAFIGGGCCVHLSVEYAPVVPTAQSVIMIIVTDSEGTLLAWAKTEQPGGHYQVKENVVTTKPGATVLVAVSNATARVRWCEVFSC